MARDNGRRKGGRHFRRPLERIRMFAMPGYGEIDRKFDFSMYEFAKESHPGGGDDDAKGDAGAHEDRNERAASGGRRGMEFGSASIWGSRNGRSARRPEGKAPEARYEAGGDNREETERVWRKYLAANGVREGRDKKTGNKLVTWAAGITAVLALAGMIYILRTKALNEKYDALLGVDTFYEGVYVDDIALGGMTMQEARQQIEALQQGQLSNVKVAVKWKDEERYEYTAQDVDVSFDTDGILQRAYDEGRTGTKKERYRYVLSLVDQPVKYYTTMTVNPDALEGRIREIANSKEMKAQEPSVQFNPDPELPKKDWFDYTTASFGIETDDQTLWNNVRGAFVNKTFGEVEIPYYEIPVEGEPVDLAYITSEILTFRTHMTSDPNREHNVALCCSMINGAVVYPGQEWSFNDTTGERTVEKGFREANVIIGGNQLVPGIAGGVCQVSGTLYNALLRAGLEITERHHHSFELSYLTRGRDATVDYGTADLKFVNNKKYPVYIAMYTEGQEVYATVFGEPLPDGQYMDLYVKTDQVIDPGDGYFVSDPEIPKGSAPVVVKERVGIRCTVFRVLYDRDGNKLDTKQLYQDYYRPYSEEWHVNPADYAFYTSTPTPAQTEHSG